MKKNCFKFFDDACIKCTSQCAAKDRMNVERNKACFFGCQGKTLCTRDENVIGEFMGCVEECRE